MYVKLMIMKQLASTNYIMYRCCGLPLKLPRIADACKLNMKQSVSANYIMYRCCGLPFKLSIRIADVCKLI